MSAHIIFCYAPQRKAVVSYMQEIGAQVNSRSPCGIDDPHRLAGCEHINFMYIDGMRPSVPQEIWEVLRVRGAVVLRVDDHWARKRHIIGAQHMQARAG